MSRTLALLLLLAACAFSPASAQQTTPTQDPPARIARLNVQQGTVSFSPAGDDSWYDVVPNRPITSGDRLWTDRDSRAEVFIGSTAVRTDARSSLEFTQIDDGTIQLTLMQGSLDLHIRDDPDDQRIEVDTGNLALVILSRGDYRIDADPAAGTTRVAVAAGSATVYGENGAPLPLGSRQQITVSGRDLGTAETRVPQTAAAFDRWVGEQNLIDERSASARFVSRDVVGYQQLDAYGDWRSDASYGSIWYPRNVAADWAPYQQGQWIDVAPWGWTWVDAAPWGFAPSHYGRWARVGPRWGWVPGRIDARPVFVPALVGFVGGSGPGTGTGTGTDGRNGVGWFPLAPGERWQPGFRASQRYVDRANRTVVYVNGPLQRNDVYVNQRFGPAVTMVPAERFGRGPIDRRDFVRQRDDSLSHAPVAFAPPLTLTTGAAVGGVALGALRTRPSAAVPPPMMQPRAPMAQLAPIQPIQPRTQIYSTEGSAQQQRQQQLNELDRRREEQQQQLHRQHLQQQASSDQRRRAAEQQEQQRRDVQRQQESRVNAARDQQEQDRQRQADRRQQEQRHEQQREQEQRLQMQRAERDRQEQNRQLQFRQEQQRQIQQQEQRQAQQDLQQRATQLRAQEQAQQQQRQQDRQHQQQQQASRLQDIRQSQERANEQRRDDQRRNQQR
ncbi:DUF6600 domain-containing protein [Variovorax sp. RHLX14]|uniref:DUF6600 domain-containing protein n=1 Tax=Variovorax sp. RHLX14 TaxID=1259731 RepID=UPI003F483002